jgi:hypothetical protein
MNHSLLKTYAPVSHRHNSYVHLHFKLWDNRKKSRLAQLFNFDPLCRALTPKYPSVQHSEWQVLALNVLHRQNHYFDD